MSKPTKGRVLELPNPTNEQPKAISRVFSSIKADTGWNFEKFYVAAIGSKHGYADEDKKNLQKGNIAQWKASNIYRWVVEHYLPVACYIAPKVFDPSLLTRWRDFVRKNGIYDRLSFHFPDELGLTGRSRRQPIADRPIPLVKSYLFDLDCGRAGKLLTLEAKGDNRSTLFLRASCALMPACWGEAVVCFHASPFWGSTYLNRQRLLRLLEQKTRQKRKYRV